MSKIEMLRVFVNERLTAATEEIFGVVKSIIGEYEDEVQRQRMLLNVFLGPEVRLHRIDDPQHLSVSEAEGPPECHRYEQTWSHRGRERLIRCNVSEQTKECMAAGQERVVTEVEFIHQVKEEQEGFQMSQEGFGLQQAEEAENKASSLNPAAVPSDHNHDQTTFSHVNQSQKDRDGDGCPLPSVSTDGHMTTQPAAENWGVSEPGPSSDGSGAERESGGEENSCSPGQDQGFGTSLRSLAMELCQVSKGHSDGGRQRTRVTRAVTLRICVLPYPHIRTLSILVSRHCPVQKLKVPYGLQEEGFLKLLRASFPQLTDRPFDVLKTDSRRRLCPLKLDKLTPEQIIRSSALGRSALYIRLKENQENSRTSPMSVQLQQPEEAFDKDSTFAPTSVISDHGHDERQGLENGNEDHLDHLVADLDGSGVVNEASEQDSSPRLRRRKPGFQSFGHRIKSGRTLRICILVDPNINVLTVGVSRKCPVQKLQVPYGLQEEEFFKLLRASFPQLTDRPFDVLKTDSRRRLCPLKLDKLTPEQIIRSSALGRSALYIRLKENQENSRTSPMSVQLQQPEEAFDKDSTFAPTSVISDHSHDERQGLESGNEDHLNHLVADLDGSGVVNEASEQDSSPRLRRRKPGFQSFGHRIKSGRTLRICILVDPNINVLTVGVSRKCPVQKLKVPYGLQEEEFFKLLRASFPQLTDRPFDVLKTDSRRRLCPLKLDKLNPERIVKSSALGRSALYIRLKVG